MAQSDTASRRWANYQTIAKFDSQKLTPKLTHPCTWRMYQSFLIILMATAVPGVTTNVLDFRPGFQKYITHRVNDEKESSRTSMYLEDDPELPDHPVCDHDTWRHLKCTGFCPRFPEIYDTWGQ